MLVLSRRLHEKVLFPDIKAAVQVVSIRAGVVRLGIEAPPEVTILREEVQDRAREWTQPSEAKPANHSADFKLRQLNQLVGNRLQITDKGLALLRKRLEEGLNSEAAAVLDEIQNDLELLRERLDGEVARSAPHAGSKNGQSRRALLVEDNANERELLATFLRAAGLDVDTTCDGSDALDYLRRRGQPDVMLLDMSMPRCDGATVVREIRHDPHYSGLKIFAVTGHMPGEFDLANGPDGVDRWFHKPIDPAVLVHDLHQELATSSCGL